MKISGVGKELAPLSLSAQIDAMLVDEQPSPEQLEIFRRMTPGRRLEVAEDLWRMARELKAVGLRSQHRDWTESQVAREVARIFANART